MEVYILDSLFRRDRVVDRFESLIWTERFKAYGDFEIVIRSTVESRSLFKAGVRLAMNESYRVMTVETVEDGTDDDGKKVLNVKGYSLEKTLEDRVARQSMSSLTATPSWTITNPPAAVVRQLFHDICVTGILDPKDIIPNLVEGTFMPSSTIAEPIDPITDVIEPKDLYTAITEVCDVWNIGFRILRDINTSQLYWDVYAGSDRTSGQSLRTPVIFAPELDNLKNTTELNSIAGSKNVAYVFAKNGFMVVYPQDADTSADGFDRRILMVDASDIELAAGAALDAAMLQRGKEELSKARAFQAFDGEINQSSQYRYQRDYYLGDVVEMRNSDGVMNQMRVTEQIFVSDKEGERSYPTLEINQFINTGSWLSWESNKHWIDYDADTETVWSTLP